MLDWGLIIANLKQLLFVCTEFDPAYIDTYFGTLNIVKISL